MLQPTVSSFSIVDWWAEAHPTVTKIRHFRAGRDPDRSVSVFRAFRETDESSFPPRRESRPLGGGNIQRLSEDLEVLDSHFRGNDGGAVSVLPDKYTQSKIPSFPRKQKSCLSDFGFFGRFRKLMNRHSRAGGNPDRSVRKLIG